MSRVDTNHSLAELLERQTNLLQFSRSQANRVDQASGTSRSNSHNSTAITTTTILIIISIGTTTTTTIDVGKWVLLIRRLTLVSATFASCGQWEVTRVKERESLKVKVLDTVLLTVNAHTLSANNSVQTTTAVEGTCVHCRQKNTHVKSGRKRAERRGKSEKPLRKAADSADSSPSHSAAASQSQSRSEWARVHPSTSLQQLSEPPFLLASPPAAERRTARNWATLSIAWHRHELCLLMSYAIDMAAASAAGAAGAAGVHWPHWIALIAYSLQHYYSYSLQWPDGQWMMSDCCCCSGLSMYDGMRTETWSEGEGRSIDTGRGYASLQFQCQCTVPKCQWAIKRVL